MKVIFRPGKTMRDRKSGAHERCIQNKIKRVQDKQWKKK